LRFHFLVINIRKMVSAPRNCDHSIYFHFCFSPFQHAVVQIWPEIRCQKFSFIYIVFLKYLNATAHLRLPREFRSLDFLGISYCHVFLAHRLKFVNLNIEEIIQVTVVLTHIS